MQHPLVYEVNARWWLSELSASTGKAIRLGDVPEGELERIRHFGFTHVWLMGVWNVGTRSRATALGDPELHRIGADTLPHFSEQDIAGSPFAVADYKAARQLGGDVGLRELRRRLNKAGLKLILDFVPNHVGLDHHWLANHPEWFVHRTEPVPETFRVPTSAGELWVAHGKDPNFPAWCDTAQLDYRRPEVRAAMIEQIKDLASRCDGLRCDMAMLLLNDVFVQTWQQFPCSQPPPATEFWEKAIAGVRSVRQDFLMIAEAYWNLEERLQALGFDYTYDKQLYDRLVAHDSAGAQRHLLENTPKFIGSSVHFLENHDEARITTLLSLAEHKAAALLTFSLPGMRLIFQGQTDGVRIHTRVQLGRRAAEEPNLEIEALYERLLGALAGTAVGHGEGSIRTPVPAWADNPTWQDLVAVQWRKEGPEFDLVVVNLAPHSVQCYVPLDVPELESFNWRMEDLLGQEKYERYGDDLRQQGVYLDVPPHAAQLFVFKRL